MPAALTVTAVIAGSLLSLTGTAPAAAPGLKPGESRFWRASGASSSTFWLPVSGGGARLRVAVDDATTSSSFDVRVSDPAGRLAASADHEAFVFEPEPGLWEIEVRRTGGDAKSFRLRAKLERAPRFGPPAPLRPNLRAEPAYDFTFSYPNAVCEMLGAECPATPAPPPPFCAVDETVEDQAARCLRFSFGYQNAGDGPLELRFGELDPGTRSVPVTQRIFLSDRTPYDYTDNEYVERDAARATYHEVHGHFHYDNVFGAELLAVVDEEKGKMKPVAEVAKRGACAHDIAFVDFDRFFQDPQHASDSGTDCNFTFTNPTSPAVRIGLSAGWGDIYQAGLSDNYVDFGLNGDGLYVLQVKADVDGTIEETNERDNYGYSLIRVEGLEVELLERGRGKSPWDPRKVVVRGLGE